MALPTDSNSLLVPVYLQAWGIDSSSKQTLAMYEANYNNLSNFDDPLPAPFSSSPNTPEPGVYIKWALPDALTHSELNAQGVLEFPSVPNRWLVVRSAPVTNNKSGSLPAIKAWVIQSDYLDNNGTSGSSAYLDPTTPSGISNNGSSITVNTATIGNSYTLSQWNTNGDPGSPGFNIQAVAPGNISFAAYHPFSNNVFSFYDGDVPAPDGNIYTYSYMVVGWYSEASQDPLYGLSSGEEFSTLLANYMWSLLPGTQVPDAPPTTSLYHGFVADVQWPTGIDGNVNLSNVQVAVGNTGADALSALIQNYAQVQSQSDPGHSSAWLAAGNTLGTLIQAAMLNLLNDFSLPGGAALVQQKVEKSWFGSDAGGTIWKVAATTAQNNTFNPAADNLTDAQNEKLTKYLGELNAQQQTYDAQQRALTSAQAQLYMTWLTYAQSKTKFAANSPYAPTTVPDWTTVLQPVFQNSIYPGQYSAVWQQCCAQAALLALLPDPVNMINANTWANNTWQFPSADGSSMLTLADLGLSLKATAAPPFYHPVDPVVLVCGANRANIYGEDGIYNPNGTLTVRLGNQTITGVNTSGSNGSFSVNTSNFDATYFTTLFSEVLSCTAVPSIPNLLTEAFFSDPNNAALIAGAVSGDKANAFNNSITTLLNQYANSTPVAPKGSWQGTPPSPVAYSLWEQPWLPLWMEWGVNYYPTVSDANNDFDFGSWTYNGTQYSWNGTGIETGSTPLQFTGRSVVAPYAQYALQDVLQNYLSHNPGIDSTQLSELLNTVMNWDILSQSLSGLNKQLITLLSQTSFQPKVSGPTPTLPCPVPANVSPLTGPPVGDLVQGQFTNIPVLETSLTYNSFFPLRGGLVWFSQNNLQLVDVYGQTYNLYASASQGTQGFQPLISPSLALPSGQSSPTGPGITYPFPFVLGPRIIQSSRLDLNFLANDGSSQLTTATDTNNPVCGWLLPNHLNNSIVVYDGDGVLLGELLQLPAPNNWRPRPGPAGTNPPPATPADIANTTLQNVVVSLAAQSQTVLEDFVQAVDETMWMSDPMGGQSDAFLPALIGRPLAVVMMQVGMELNGNAAYNQLFDEMLTPTSTATNFTQVFDTGNIETIPFPVTLGSLQLRNDGLMGYFITDNTVPYSTFYTVHPSPLISAGDTFIEPIINTSTGAYQGGINVNPDGNPVTVTLIMDPMGVVHGYSGVLPVTSAALPGYLVQNFLKTMLVNFQTGPLLKDPGPTLRTPQPAEKQGVWNWLQNTGGTWEQSTIVNANDSARFPLMPPALIEGWLQLTNISED